MKARGLGLLGLGLCVGWMAATMTTTSLRAVAGDSQENAPLKKWTEGKGWGWVWGPEDEVGALNEMTDASRLAALKTVREGKVYDLGVPYNRNSYKWPGHSPGEVMTYRSPEGVKRQGDVAAFVGRSENPVHSAWHSCALFINDNVATQIDGLGHVTAGEDNHWYNGFKESSSGGDFGLMRCSADTIPPVVARGVMLDIAGAKNLDALSPHYVVTLEDVQAALEKQKTELRPGDVVLFRTGTLRFWGKDGADHAKISAHDSAGPDLQVARYLVEKKGAMLLGSDTSGLECNPAPQGSNSPIPVHNYLLVEQGIHIGEYHNLEELARDQVYEFCYVALTNRVIGAASGFCMRPIAIR